MNGPAPEEIALIIDPTAMGSDSRVHRKAALNKARNVCALYEQWGGWSDIRDADKNADAILVASEHFSVVGHWDENWEAWRVGRRSDPKSQSGGVLAPTHYRNIGRLPASTEVRYQS